MTYIGGKCAKDIILKPGFLKNLEFKTLMKILRIQNSENNTHVFKIIYKSIHFDHKLLE